VTRSIKLITAVKHFIAPALWVDPGNTKGRSITVPLTSCLTGLESSVRQLTIFVFYLQNRLIQTGQTGGQWYSDTSPFSIPWLITSINFAANLVMFMFSKLDSCRATNKFFTVEKRITLLLKCSIRLAPKLARYWMTAVANFTQKFTAVIKVTLWWSGFFLSPAIARKALVYCAPKSDKQKRSRLMCPVLFYGCKPCHEKITGL
jgi:hypothetical protein